MKQWFSQPPLSLYIHMPWCIRKCPYCDFNSYATNGPVPEKFYIDRLIIDLKQHLTAIAGRKIHSIFIGGGTPSLISPKAYDHLFQQLQLYLNIPNDIEITLEANPGSVEQIRFRDYRIIGINRLSLGIQSFQDDKLKTLGRIHTSDAALHAITVAQDAKFTNINLDLMYGLPYQNIEDALFDLTTAIMTQPTHLSWYQLTLEPNTYFYKFPPNLPADDAIIATQIAGQNLLAQNNFECYEISAYATPDNSCNHNLNYWEFGDYIGIGAGAHSKLTTPHGIIRYWNIKNPKDYLDENKGLVTNKRKLTSRELPLEFMMNALRLQKPIAVDLFARRTNLTLDDIQRSLTAACNKELLNIEDHHFVVTALGKRYLNDLLELFLPDD